MERNNKLTILDFDGTILDSSMAWLDVYLSYCTKNNLKISEKIKINQYEFSYTECLREIKSIHNITQLSNEMLASLNKISKEVYKKIQPKKGFAEFIKERHRSNSKIIIVSREEPGLVKSYLEQHQIFEIIEVFQDINKLRARTKFYTDLSKKYGCNTKNITVIDDSLSHCNTARQAEVFVVGMDDNHSFERKKQMKLICEMYINDFTPLLKL